MRWADDDEFWKRGRISANKKGYAPPCRYLVSRRLRSLSKADYPRREKRVQEKRMSGRWLCKMVARETRVEVR